MLKHLRVQLNGVHSFVTTADGSRTLVLECSELWQDSANPRAIFPLASQSEFAPAMSPQDAVRNSGFVNFTEAQIHFVCDCTQWFRVNISPNNMRFCVLMIDFGLFVQYINVTLSGTMTSWVHEYICTATCDLCTNSWFCACLRASKNVILHSNMIHTQFDDLYSDFYWILAW